MGTSSCHFTKMDNTGEWSLGADPEFSFRPDGLEISGDVTEELGCVDRPGVQRRNLG